MQKYIFISEEEKKCVFHNLFPCLIELTTTLNYTFLRGMGRGLDGGWDSGNYLQGDGNCFGAGDAEAVEF